MNTLIIINGKHLCHIATFKAFKQAFVDLNSKLVDLYFTHKILVFMEFVCISRSISYLQDVFVSLEILQRCFIFTHYTCT